MKRSYKLLFAIIVIGIFAGFYDYPLAWDRGINWWNNHINYPKLPGFHKTPFKLGLDLAGGTHP